MASGQWLEVLCDIEPGVSGERKAPRFTIIIEASDMSTGSWHVTLGWAQQGVVRPAEDLAAPIGSRLHRPPGPVADSGLGAVGTRVQFRRQANLLSPC